MARTARAIASQKVSWAGLNGRLHRRTHQKAISGGANSTGVVFDGQDGALRIRDLAGFRGALGKGVERVGSAVRAVPSQYIDVHVTPLRGAPLYKLRPPAAPKSGASRQSCWPTTCSQPRQGCSRTRRLRRDCKPKSQLGRVERAPALSHPSGSIVRLLHCRRRNTQWPGWGASDPRPRRLSRRTGQRCRESRIGSTRRTGIHCPPHTGTVPRWLNLPWLGR